MAEVDFSHAKIEPADIWGSNPTKNEYVSLNNKSYLYDRSTNYYVSTEMRITTLVNAQKQLVIQYQGSFTTNGTEFFIRGTSNDAGWRVYNISFSSGDTFIFQIKADLICQ